MANPFVHFELSTDNIAASKAFYQKLFDWKFTYIKDMDYTMFDVGQKDTGGGIQKKMMADQPTGWLSYVQVASVQKTLDKAAAAGATVVVPYTPIGGMGAMGIFVDPAGASLGIWERAAPAKKAAKKSAKKAAKKTAKKAAKPAKKVAKKAAKKKAK
ncbi:MAG: VOC family protein [Deltaproteobacteria bacterium]|nr:VOC family protein [Deltaproteobacteria bacterium]